MSNQSSRKAPWITLGKMAVTVAIFTFLLSRIDLDQFGQALKESFGFWLMSAFVVNALALITSTCKWDRLLRVLGIFSPLRKLLALYTIGFFASSFLPGVIGGDVVRCYMMGQGAGGHLRVAVTIVVERFSGAVALVLMCLLVVIWDHSHFATLPVLTFLGAMSCVLLGTMVTALNRRLATGLMYRTRRQRIGRVIRPLYQFHQALRGFPWKPLWVALAYSCIFYLVCGLIFFFLCKAFEVHITYLGATSVQLLICLLTLIPISMGGLGLAQAGDVYLLGILGIDATHALAISIMRQFLSYVYALIGGMLFIRWQGHPGILNALDLRADTKQLVNMPVGTEGQVATEKRMS